MLTHLLTAIKPSLQQEALLREVTADQGAECLRSVFPRVRCAALLGYLTLTTASGARLKWAGSEKLDSFDIKGLANSSSPTNVITPQLIVICVEDRSLKALFCV